MKKQFIAKLLALALVLSLAPMAMLTASASVAGSNDPYANNPYGGGTNNPYGGTNDPYNGYVDSVPVDSTTTVGASDITVEDGSATIKAKVVGGIARVNLSQKAVAALAEQVTGDAIVIKIEAANATKVDVSMPAKALTAAAEKTGADLTIESPVATITIPNEALATLFGNTGTVKISAQASGSKIGFTIQVSGKSLKNIKGLQVTF